MPHPPFRSDALSPSSLRVVSSMIDQTPGARDATRTKCDVAENCLDHKILF